MRLRAALVGAGLVGQASHALTLFEERERFEFVAVVDASETVRTAVAARYGASHAVATLDELLPLGVDAIVCAVPDAAHRDVTVAALDAGLHVFCEKPLALSVADCDDMLAAAERNGRVLQCGYMKLHDPSFHAFLERLPTSPDEVACISVEVNDPESVPFVSHLPMVAGRDVDPELIATTRRRTRASVAAAAGREVDDADARGFDGYLSSVVHDLSVVHAMLDRIGHPVPAPVASAAYWDRGRCVSLDLALEGGGRASLRHLGVEDVADYTERVTAYCRDRILELTFPSPYLRFHPTRLVEKRTGATATELVVSEVRTSYEEAFRNELRSFHASITEGAPVVGDAARARTDVAVLLEGFRLAAASRATDSTGSS
jgi:predicted dehydrogenase